MPSVKLWHIPMSHFSEKARWALDYKSVDHERLAPVSGAHMAVALWLTRGRRATFPVVEIDGRRVSDTTAIIAALEERFPDPPLYPADPEERRRALELEDWFDRELGPPIRQLVWHEYGQDQDQLMAVSASQAPEWMNAGIARLPGRAAVGAKRAGTAYARAFTVLRYRAANSGDAERSREAVLGALDRLEAELSGRQYLVGDRFSVADLTAASLLYALALPPGAPVGPELMPESFNRFREDLADRPGYRWIEEMYRRHRARPDA